MNINKALFLLPGCSEPGAEENGVWVTEYRQYTSQVADKSDGFIPVNRTRWKESDSYPQVGNVNTNGANKNNTNIYFDGHDEADGGYNHWEMRDVTRDYGNYDTSQPMRLGAEWMNTRFVQ